MFKSKGARSGIRLAAVLAVCSLGATGLQAAAVVGQWNQNASSYNWATASNYSSLYSAAFVTGGHSIDPSGTDGSTVLSNLNNYTHFVMNTSSTATVGNLGDLSTWVNGGGILILFANGNNDAASNAVGNTILGVNGINSSISLPGGVTGISQMATIGSLTGSDPAVNGITGQPLTWYRSNLVSGGTALAANNSPFNQNLGNALRVDNIGLGKVYVFGEHFENDSRITGGVGNANLQLFLNLLTQGQLQTPGGGGSPGGGGGPLPPGSDVPEPATILLTASALAGLAYFKRKR